MNTTAAEFRRQNHPLPTALSAAVPLWAATFCGMPLEEVLDPKATEAVLKRIQDAGEAILYRVPGKSADGFNALAEGIARLAFVPGGVKVFGLHFQYEPGKWADGKHGVPVPGGMEDGGLIDVAAVTRTLYDRIRVRRPG